ncbi:MAG TPA: NAD(P)H-dependent glycerol-3-phosphate dehydrogenase [Burkholderiaceae bacterium]|nr:NAD(P)H-dependent glycerol-3-phosphate dehydrogenase [Burkholderiaceae bacterium]
MPNNHLVVVGAGSWGTALAMAALRSAAFFSPAAEPPATAQVTLLARDADQAAAMQATRENARYLPGVALPPNLQISADAAVLSNASLVLLVTPFAGLTEWFGRLAALPTQLPVLWAAKGLDAQTGEMAHELAARLLPGPACGVVSGPSFASEVARGLPCALTVASSSEALQQLGSRWLHGPTLRVYRSADVTGVEVGGAVKNVIAIATGMCDGLNLGLNARAALITRGLAEMSRFAVALGARPETLAGLTGLGDLILTATGELSRNRRFGLEFARDGRAHGDFLAEGARCARAVQRRAQALGVEMPITACVAEIVDGQLSPQAAAQLLLARTAKAE